MSTFQQDLEPVTIVQNHCPTAKFYVMLKKITQTETQLLKNNPKLFGFISVSFLFCTQLPLHLMKLFHYRWNDE